MHASLEGLLGLEALDFIFTLIANRSVLRNVKPSAPKATGSKAKQAAEARGSVRRQLN